MVIGSNWSGIYNSMGDWILFQNNVKMDRYENIFYECDYSGKIKQLG